MIRNIEKPLKEVIMSKVGSIKGNIEEDIIYLLGNKEEDGKNTFYKDIEIAISDGANGKLTYIDLKDIEGYNPRIVIGEFRDPSKCEVLFIIEDKLEKKGSRALVYKFKDNKLVNIFDSSNFSIDKKYEVIYNDYYKVKLFDSRKKEEYIINIENKDDRYLKEKYNSNGKLKKNCNGYVLPAYDILSVRNSNREVMDILLKQKIVGEDINDALGEIISILRFDESEYSEIDTFISISTSKNISINYRKEEFLEEKYDFSKVDFIESEYNANLRVERSIEKEFSLTPNFDKLTYLYNRVKLKNTPKYQILAYLEGPRFCSGKGGTLVVLEEKNNHYVVTSKINDIIPPIIVSENISNGYNDLIVRVMNKGKGDFRVLKYNGNSYPMNPINEEKLKNGIKVIGVAAISDDLFYRNGIEY